MQPFDLTVLAEEGEEPVRLHAVPVEQQPKDSDPLAVVVVEELRGEHRVVVAGFRPRPARPICSPPRGNDVVGGMRGVEASDLPALHAFVRVRVSNAEG